MLGLDYNLFFSLSKYYLLGNAFNGKVMKFALENIFIGEYVYLELFIFGIYNIIAKEALKSSQKACRKNKLWPPKILERDKGKTKKKLKAAVSVV